MAIIFPAFMRDRLAAQASAGILALFLWGTVLATGVERSFNKEAFKPFLTTEAFEALNGTPESFEVRRKFLVSSDAPSSLDQKVLFTSCKEVIDFNQDWVAAGRHFRDFRGLKVDCKALDIYSQSAVAKHSYLPAELTGQVVKKLPSLVVPPVSSEDKARRRGNTLGELHPELRIIANDRGGMTLNTSDSEVDIDLIGRADVDGDGYQDWLLRVFRDFIGGRGNITALVCVTRMGSSRQFELDRLY